MTTFNSGLSASIRSYLTLKRALGRQYTAEEWVLAPSQQAQVKLHQRVATVAGERR